ncbi:MAG TPA: hypothetical protein VMU93_11170 [Caulobacteraceae bacterium]|nr:hypothetical protein [Caulobacteraceae bacterium]
MDRPSRQLLDQWRRDEATEFRGWDFSHLRQRVSYSPLPWDYLALAREQVRRCGSLLDLATGDGAVLASFPGLAAATEGHAPNVAIAAERLAPLGVRVVAARESAPLPFAAAAFDLILNRHGGLHAGAIAQALRRGGRFLTQQVGGRSLADLIAHFGARPRWPGNVLGAVAAQFAVAGFDVELAEESSGVASFADVGAVVYYLKAVPWLVDGFGVEAHLPRLQALQQRLEARGRLEFATNSFLLLATRR